MKWILAVMVFLVITGSVATFYVLHKYRQQLQELVIAELQNRYDITAQFSDARISVLRNWPKGTIRLRNVTLRSRRMADSHLKAEWVSLSFHLTKLLRKEFLVTNLSINNGDILFTKNPGRKRRDSSRKSDNDASAIAFEIKKIALKDCRIQLRNAGKGQDISLFVTKQEMHLRHFADGISARLKSKMMISGLQFRAGKGRFLSKSEADLNLRLTWISRDRTLCIQPGSTAEVNGDTYNVAAVAQFGDEKQLGLIIENKKADYQAVTKLMNYRIRKSLENFRIKKPLHAKVIITTPIGKREEPAFIVNLTGNKNDLQIGTSRVPYSGISFKARIVCVDSTLKRGDIAHAYAQFSPMKGLVYSFPFRANVTIRNLINPYVEIDGVLHADAKKLKKHFGDTLNLTGSLSAQVKYAGPADKLTRSEFLSHPMKLKATVLLNNFGIVPGNEKLAITGSGIARATNASVSLDKIQLHTAPGNATVSGTVAGALTRVFGMNNQVTASLSVAMDTLDLNPLFATEVEKSPAKTTPGNASTATSPLANTAKKIDGASNNVDVKLSVKSAKIKLRRVEGSDAQLQVAYTRGHLEFPKIQMSMCGGALTAQGGITALKTFTSDFTLSNADVHELFTRFENFGQNAITSQNIRGRLHVEGQFNASITHKMSIAPETMYASVNVVIKDGELVEFEPVKKLSNFLFKNRDFNRVRFSELREAFTLRGPLIEITELEVASSLLNLYVVNGVYNFRGDSFINLLIPWNNLKKRNKHHIPLLSGKTADDTKGVKVNFAGPPNQMKIGLGHREPPRRRSSI